MKSAFPEQANFEEVKTTLKLSVLRFTAQRYDNKIWNPSFLKEIMII
jgi:hypothetical protein